MEDVSTGVIEKNKEYLRSKDKAKNDMMYQDIYNCICQIQKNEDIHYGIRNQESGNLYFQHNKNIWTS